jgi:hypothetical protein
VLLLTLVIFLTVELRSARMNKKVAMPRTLESKSSGSIIDIVSPAVW